MSEPERPELVRRLLDRREEHRERHIAYRVAFAIAGGLILAAGIVMLVTPGPAFLLIPVGLAMLAIEFDWAERLLVKALMRAERAREKARAMSTGRKVAGGLAGAAAAAGALFLALRFVV
jgi:uncharacterized protein (TIGR02611 family)